MTEHKNSDGSGENRRPASLEPQASAAQRRPQGLIGDAEVAPGPSEAIPPSSAETEDAAFTAWLEHTRIRLEGIKMDQKSMKLSTEIINFDDAGANDDHPVKGITMGHIRRWFDAVEEAEAACVELAALISDPNNPTADKWPCANEADRDCLQRAYNNLLHVRAVRESGIKPEEPYKHPLLGRTVGDY
jgi:hypothetical protein